MPTESDPIAGNWYQHRDKGQIFHVIDVDETGAMITTQHFDGDIEGITLDEWYEMELEPIEAPEDWTGPMDDITQDDLGYTDTAMGPADWAVLLEEITMVVTDEPESESEDSTEAQQEPGVELIPYRE